jgi:hypothetical protein
MQLNTLTKGKFIFKILEKILDLEWLRIRNENKDPDPNKIIPDSQYGFQSTGTVWQE